MKNAAALLSIVCILALALVGELAEAPRIVLLANSVDYELAADFIEFLQGKGMNVTRSTAPDFEQYKSEKEKIADTVVALLDKRFPGLASQVEMRDVASPSTFVRYTGNWKGSFEGWQITPKTWSFGRPMRKTLPGLANFYLAGQWVEPGGGLPAVAMSGRNVVQIICKKERKKFTTTK